MTNDDTPIYFGLDPEVTPYDPTSTSFSVACKKTLVLVDTNKGAKPVSGGDAEFEIACSVQHESSDPVKILLNQFSYELAFKVDSDNALTGIIDRIGSLLPGGGGRLDSVDGIFKKTGNLFTNHIFPRRLRVGVKTTGYSPKLCSVSLDIKVSSSEFGQGNNQSQHAAFLVTYSWSADEKRVLDPSYRVAADLRPITTSPVIQLDVVTLITLANIYLDQTQFTVKATLQSKPSVAGDKASTVSYIDLGRTNLAASCGWDQKSEPPKFQLGITSILTPSVNSKHPTSALLTGSLDYSSKDKNLISVFDKDSADHVLPLIDSLLVDHLTLYYEYTGNRQSAELKGKSVSTYFKFGGKIQVGDLLLTLDFHFMNKKGWEFTASLEAEDEEATIGSILSDILGDDTLDLPDFVAETKISAKNNSGGISLAVEKSPGKEGMFQFMSSIQIGELALTFAQIHLAAWGPNLPSKRLVKFGLVGLPPVDLPVIGNLTQPFDEMYLMWVQDGTGINKTNPGLNRQEIAELNKTLTRHPLVPKDKYPGGGIPGNRTCVLDYNFKKSKPEQPKPQPEQARALALTSRGEQDEPEQDEPPKSDSDGNSASAPFKKKTGPLSISNIGLKYANKKLHIQFTATFELGPIGFSLIGFSINVRINSLHIDGIELLDPSLEGLSASFEKPPLTIAGIIRHEKDQNNLEYYAGGLIVGWVPYQLQAAGFYGDAMPEGSNDPKSIFNSAFVFARLGGPLVTLEFAEISGVTGGFGYKSEADGWFKPLDDTYWAAAGMKIDAFQMISLQAVAVMQFGQSIKMGLFAVALADIPTSASKVKFAHVELGIAVVVDLDYGTFKAEAQLSPNSYILDPNCHLTGGFALYYWFEAPHCDRSLVGDFAFTLGGYHQAFDIPKGYPNPPRLGISWSLGSALSITGQAYFAITPKACMGGGRLHTAYHAGPIEAWFDVFADFLINYKPFHFLAEVGVSIGVRFNLDVLFIHIHISVEAGADLTLWGPPFAGTVYVNIKVAKFHINFGRAGSDKPPCSLLEFYNLVLQASSKTTQSSKSIEAPALAATTAAAQADNRRVIELDEDDEPISIAAEAGEDDPPKKNDGHTFLAQSGLMNDTSEPERTHNQTWIVRGGTFAFMLGCKIAIAKAEQVDEKDKPFAAVEYTKKAIYARPMHLTDPLDSSVKISITEEGSHDPPKEWRMEKNLCVFVCADYKTTDPSQSGNNIPSLLDTSDCGVPLMMGVLLRAPPPLMSEDKLPTFKILDAERTDIDANNFPVPAPAIDQWVGAPALEHEAQWNEVHKAWEAPDWDGSPAAAIAAGGGGEEEKQGERGERAGTQTSFVKTWAAAFGWDAGLAKVAKMPSLLNSRFDELTLAD
ncbi:hypothetical protein VTI74DRAFT_5191 [Chaetomium olivicolor]